MCIFVQSVKLHKWYVVLEKSVKMVAIFCMNPELHKLGLQLQWSSLHLILVKVMHNCWITLG